VAAWIRETWHSRIKLLAVSDRAKLILLAIVLAGDFVCVDSPLPELAATSTLKFPAFPLILVFILLSPTGSSQVTRLVGDGSWPDWNILLTRICVRLC